MKDGARVRRALGLLFAGMLLVLLDLGIDGFDLLPDPAGWLLTTVALGELRYAHHDDVLGGRATAAWLLAWVATALGTVVYVTDVPFAIDVVDTLVVGVQPVVTALALLRLVQITGVPDLNRSWRTTAAALVATFVFTHFVILLAETTHTDDIDALGVLAVVVFLAAFTHYLVSILRTRSAFAS